MQPGQVIGPIRGPSGFQLVKLVEQRDAAGEGTPVTEFHARHILVAGRRQASDEAAARQKIETLPRASSAARTSPRSPRKRSDDE